MSTGIVNLNYLGDDDTLPESVRLRAASQRAELDDELDAGPDATAVVLVAVRDREHVRQMLGAMWPSVGDSADQALDRRDGR